MQIFCKSYETFARPRVVAMASLRMCKLWLKTKLHAAQQQIKSLVTRNKSLLYDFVQYLKQKFFALPQRQRVLSMFLNLGHFMFLQKRF